MDQSIQNTSSKPINRSSLYDWEKIIYYLLLSRGLDAIEELELVPAKKVYFQFSARGHDLAQILLASKLNHSHDGASCYYRSRPFVLTSGIPLYDVASSPLGKAGGYSDGRDIGVVSNYPGLNGICIFPMQGGVGAQFTPASGWAQSINYHLHVLKDESYRQAIAVTLAGDAAVATGGFWSALNMATTLKLPQLFFIEDNGYGISVPSSYQTPYGEITKNLSAYQNLKILDGKGYEVSQAADLINEAVQYTRSHQGPCLLRLQVPRLSGHSFLDNQRYKSDQQIKQDLEIDPLPKLKKYLVPTLISEITWAKIENKANKDIKEIYQKIENSPEPQASQLKKYCYSENKTGEEKPDLQRKGGLWAENHHFPSSSHQPNHSGKNITIIAAIRHTLDYELKTNPRLLIFGEDVGKKGGVHGVTFGLQKKYGEKRVFDTSLNEEGIVGRAVGMAYAGLMPVAEIQFRKYSESASEQLTDCGTVRWRTANRFAAPIVVRMPIGYANRGDPWHGMSNEVEWAHKIGWQIAYPSNVEDAVGLLRNAMRGNNPTLFFEHRALYKEPWACRPYPSNEYSLAFGKSHKLCQGDKATIISWGAMVKTCEEACQHFGDAVDLIDLRTIQPWDQEATIKSVKKTGHCLIVHEDNLTAGFGAEIIAILTKECFNELKTPIERLTMPDIPSPYNLNLLKHALPSKEDISQILEKWM